MRSLRELEAEADELEGVIDQATPARVKQRIDTLREVLTATPLDRQAANNLLRQLIEHAKVDLGTGYITFRWHHGAETDVMFAWPKDG